MPLDDSGVGTRQFARPAVGRSARPVHKLAVAAITAALAATLSGCAAGRAPGSMVTDRPDFTESASTVAPGHAQLEAGYSGAVTDAAVAHDVGEVLIRAGLAGAVELRLGVGSWTRLEPEAGAATSGHAGSSLGAKLRLPSSALVPEAAVLVSTTVPLSTALGDPGWTPSVVLSGAWQAGEIGVGANVGYSHVETAEGTGEVLGSVAAGLPIREGIGAFAELYGVAPAGGRTRTVLDAGLTWAVTRNLQLDVRVGRAVGGPAQTVLGAGVSVRR